MENYGVKRIYLEVDPFAQTFCQVRKEHNVETAPSAEEAIDQLVHRLNREEGTWGLVENDGYPAGYTTTKARDLYALSYFMSAYFHQEEELPPAAFHYGGEEETPPAHYQGFYADETFMRPWLLAVHRLRRQDNELDYVVDARMGGAQAALYPYLYLEGHFYQFVPVDELSRCPTNCQ